MSDWLYSILGYFVRREACRLAAQALAGTNILGEHALAPKVWSLTVYFEQYLLEGAAGTLEDFGPSQPVKLNVISKQ